MPPGRKDRPEAVADMPVDRDTEEAHDTSHSQRYHASQHEIVLFRDREHMPLKFLVYRLPVESGREHFFVEAVIAAIFLDSNLSQAKRFIIENLKDAVEVASKNVGMKDYKTVLQEKLQVNGEVKIQYEVIAEDGPDHDKTFVVEVTCDGKALAIGRGKNKKNAEMEAAKSALENL